MNIAVVGVGYVGLVTGACFAQMGNRVIGIDIDAGKVAALEGGVIPIYEPGLEPMVTESFRNGSLRFTTDLNAALEQSSIVFIAVGTPMGEDGSADLRYVLAVAKGIGESMRHPLVIVDKSTVPVGTADKVRATVQAELDARGSDLKFEVVSNPEFLKEGSAIKDFMSPDRVVVGADSEAAMQTMRDLYSPFMKNRDRFIGMDVRSAEMTKYAANAMLATRISFMNEIANICERVGADVNQVRNGIGSDSRIGYSFIYPGCGYGGSCFPKDIRALGRTAEEHGYRARILEAVEGVNAEQKRLIPQKVVKRFGDDLSGRHFALWGLSFKPGTDDMREAPSLTVVEELTSRGATVCAYDPKAQEEAQRHYLRENAEIRYVESKYEALKGADALILVTEWQEFRSPDFEEILKQLNQPVFFDGRNQFERSRMRDIGFEYYPVGALPQ